MHDPGKTEKGHAADNVPEANRSKEAPPAYKPEQISAGLHRAPCSRTGDALKRPKRNTHPCGCGGDFAGQLHLFVLHGMREKRDGTFPL